MNIPMFTREQFNEHLKNYFDVLGIIPTDEAYESYRQFVLNWYAPIGTGPRPIGVIETDDAEIVVTAEMKKAA